MAILRWLEEKVAALQKELQIACSRQGWRSNIAPPLWPILISDMRTASKAEESIREAQESGSPWLNLNGLHLTGLPKWIGKLTKLRTLNLWGNGLTNLPKSIAKLTKLQVLNLAGNKLTSLPDWLGELTQLQALILWANRLTSLPDPIGQLTQLQTLNLGHNELTSLPDRLGELTQLQTLNLRGNELTNLPGSLTQLKQLQTLDLRKNPRLSCPRKFSTEAHGKSSISTLPPVSAVTRCTKLRSLSWARDVQARLRFDAA